MRKILLMAVLALTSVTYTASAQQSVCKGQTPQIKAKGNFSNGGSTSATITFQAATANPLYTGTVTIAGSTGVDTERIQLIGEYNSVTFQENVTRVAGRCDSFTMQVWGSIDGTNYVSLTTLTATNTSGTKAYGYTISSGQGSPYSHYMITRAEANVATGSAVNCKGYCLVR